MAAPANSLQVLHSLATASSLSPFAQQLQALQKLSDFCTSQYSSVLAPPTEFPSQQLLKAHCAATSNGLHQLTLLLQQWCSSSRPSSDSTQADDSTSSTCGTSSTAGTPADPCSRSDPAAAQVPPLLSHDALQAVLLLTDATQHTIDAMRTAVTLKAHWSALMPGRFPAVPSLQDFVASIVSSGDCVGWGMVVCLVEASPSSMACSWVPTVFDPTPQLPWASHVAHVTPQLELMVSPVTVAHTGAR